MKISIGWRQEVLAGRARITGTVIVAVVSVAQLTSPGRKSLMTVHTGPTVRCGRRLKTGVTERLGADVEDQCTKGVAVTSKPNSNQAAMVLWASLDCPRDQDAARGRWAMKPLPGER